jgi:predicted phosphodiesterase
MRYLVLSDVHGKIDALEAVLAAAGPYDALWYLGDIVGYGACPQKCIDRLRDLGAVWVYGNHDEEVGHGGSADGWTHEHVNAESTAFLAGLPEQVVLGDVTLRHSLASSLRPPVPEDFKDFSTKLCLVGHTHVPFVYTTGPRGERREISPATDQPLVLGDVRAIVNPGAVGLSFTDLGCASYLVYEERPGAAPTLTWHAVPFPHRADLERMRALGVPESLVDGQRQYMDGELPVMGETADAHRAWAAGGR